MAWSTARDAIAATSVGVAEGAQRGLVVRPAGAHAHPGFEEDLGAEQALHLFARAGTDLAQARTALADHDRLLAVALDPDHRADAEHPAVDFEALDLHGRRVRQLRAELAHQLFAHQFA